MAKGKGRDHEIDEEVFLMLRCASLVLLLLLGIGCAEPIDRTDSGDTASTGGNADDVMRGLLDQLQEALKDRDWEAVRKLHWSGMPETAQDLQEAYESKIDRLDGVGRIATLDFQPMNEETYLQYMDEDELPGPVELLTGRLEFEIPGESSPQPSILVWAYLCQEEDAAKIFGYIDLSLE